MLRVGKQTAFLRRFALAFLVMSLAACATAGPVYAPAERAGAVGYSEQRLETNRYRVSYTGSLRAERDEAEDLALLRAAELTLFESQEWFQVVTRRVGGAREPEPNRPRISVGFGLGSSSGRTSSALGVGFGTGGRSSAEEPVEVTLEVLMGSGPKPDGAYTAAELVENIRSNRLEGVGGG